MSRAVPVSIAVAGLAVAASVGAHLGLLTFRGLPEAVEIEGGGGAQVAMEGTAFADMARAVTPVATAERAAASVTPGAVAGTTLVRAAPSVAAPLMPAKAAGPTPSVPAATAAEPIAGAPALGIATGAARSPDRRPSAPTTAPRAVTVTPEPARSVVTLSASDPVATPETASDTTVTDPVQAAPDATIAAIEETMTPRLSARPPARPAAVEARAAEAVARAETAVTPTAPPAPARQGNARTDTRRGSVSGSQTGQVASSGQGRQSSAGNAAALNYPGEIQRRIARQRLPRVRASGVAQVSFTVADNGGLGALGLARSSGSAELDREAVNLVRRAAPFPLPPPGARTSFTIPVRAR